MPTQDVIRLTVAQIRSIMDCDEETALEWVDPLSGSAVIHEINTTKRMIAWLATIAHESSGLTRLEENLNYSGERLTQVWPSRFSYSDPSKADPFKYERDPEGLANFVYANRLGNGDEDSGDGWKYRGRGPIQLTGKANYDAAAASETVPDIVRFPDLVLEPPVGAMTAGWFWATNGLNALADDDQFEDIVRKVNGGLIGWNDRLRRLQITQNVLTGAA